MVLYNTIVCKNYTKVMLPKPPMSILCLEMACSASNDYMTLLPYYHKESTYVISDIYFELILMNNKSQTNLWNAFTSRLPNFTKIDIIECIKALKNFPMGHLTETLHGLGKIRKDNGNSDWVYFVIGAIIALLIVIAGFIYYKKGKYLKQLCSGKGGYVLDTYSSTSLPCCVSRIWGCYPYPEILPLHSKGQNSSSKTKCQNH